MKPTRLFSEFSLVTLPCTLCIFLVLLASDSPPVAQYEQQLWNFPSLLPKQAGVFPLMKTSDGRLGVSLYQGLGFDIDSLELIRGEPLEVTDPF